MLTRRNCISLNKIIGGKLQEKLQPDEEKAEVLQWSSTIEYLVMNKVLPSWKSYLLKKMNAELNSECKESSKLRSDAIWKKILRDSRKFYRILFNEFI